MKRHLVLSTLWFLVFDQSNITFAQKSPTAPPQQKTRAVSKAKDEAAIRADEARKVIGFAAGEDCLEVGKYYHVLSTRGVATQTNLTCFAVLQEVNKVEAGANITIWQATGTPPPRFFRFPNKYLAKDDIYAFEGVTTNGFGFKKVGAVPTIEMRLIPLPVPGGPRMEPTTPPPKPAGTKA